MQNNRLMDSIGKARVVPEVLHRKIGRSAPLIFMAAILFVLLSMNSIMADTNVSGTISVDTTWTTSGSPYIVTSSVYVKGTDGADGITTLTIEPGVEVRFNRYMKLEIGAGSGDSGALVAEGTVGTPILFTSNAATPAVGDWYGIRFQNTTDDNTTSLSNCIVEYAGYVNQGSVYIYNSAPELNDSIIRYGSSYGVYIYSGNPTLSNVTISDIANYGLYFAGTAGGSFTENTIANGLYLTSGGPETLSGNTFNWNNTYPIRIGCNDVGTLLNNNTFNGLNGLSYLDIIGGTLTLDATWPDVLPLRVTSSLTVKGTDGVDGITTLTIEPGVEVRFNKNMKLEIGASSGDPGALVAEGTTADPILFTSNEASPAAGDWYGIRFQNTTDDDTTSLSNCVVEYAGYVNQGSVYIYNSAPELHDSSIRYGSSYGVYIYSGNPTLSNVTISDIANYGLYFAGTAGGSFTGNTIANGLYLTSGGPETLSGNTFNWNNTYPVRIGCNDVGNLLNNNTFSGLDGSSYLDIIGGTLTLDATWPDVLPLRITSSLTVKGTDGVDGITTLTIEPGVEVRFNRYTKLEIGASSGDSGALIAEGTTADPILFTSNEASPAAGDWYGIRFQNTTDDDTTSLSNCVVEYAGYVNQGSVYIYNSAPELHDSSIRYGSSYGVYVYSGNPTLSNVTISDIANYGLYFTGTAGGSFTGNTIANGLYLTSGGPETLSGNTFNWNNTYPIRIGCNDVGSLLNNNILSGLDETSRLNVISGTMSLDATWPDILPLAIMGNLTIKGADGADGITTLTIQPGVKVLFNGNYNLTIGAASGDPGALVAEGTSDAPILFSSNKSTPAVGDWQYIGFYTTADTSSILDHCVVEYGGYSYGAIYLYNASPTIQNTLIRKSKNAGIYGYGTGSAGSQINCNTFTENANGLYWTITPPSELSANNFSGNTNHGIYYTGSTAITAEGNWWGDELGPNQSGDSYYGNVDADPWSTEENQCSDSGENHPPYEPNSPVPSHEAVRVSVDGGLTLAWSGGDPDVLDTVSYDLYWGTDPNSLAVMAQDIGTTEYTMTGLSRGVFYYWRIVSRDNNGLETNGPVWQFISDGDDPDLIVSNVAISPAGNLQVGDTVTFTIDIQNNGSGPVVDPFTVDFRIDSTSVGSASFDQIYLAGESLQAVQSWNCTGIDVTVDIVVDNGGQVSETDEGNNLYSAVLSSVTDNEAPLVASFSPVNQSYVQAVQEVSLTLLDSMGTVDDAAVIASISVTGNTQGSIGGTVSETGDVFTFVPDSLPLVDDVYTVAFNSVDTYGNTENYQFSFTIDSVAPGKPVITGGAVYSGTLQARPVENISDQFVVEITGMRDAGTSVWLDAVQVAATGDDDWSVQVMLNPGENAFEFWLVDLAGNDGTSEWVDIEMSTSNVINYNYDATGRIDHVNSE